MRTSIWRRSGVLGKLLSEARVPLLESSDHVFYYTPKSASILLENCGFEVEAIVTLPGNRQPHLFPELVRRAYSFFSQAVAVLSGSSLCLGPRFLVLARKSLAGISSSPTSVCRVK